MLPELTEVRARWSLVLLGSRRSEIVSYGAIGVAFDFQVHSAEVPFGRDSSSRCRDYPGGVYGAVIEGVQEQPQKGCRSLGLGWYPPIGKVRFLPGQAVECICCWFQPLYRCPLLLLVGPSNRVEAGPGRTWPRLRREAHEQFIPYFAGDRSSVGRVCGHCSLLRVSFLAGYPGGSPS